ncbi:MAG: M23 family metallopeptidase [Microbacteriaceae bacterium]|nr:M23 family metallopeptidase [Microbacteriaceae bacterium]
MAPPNRFAAGHRGIDIAAPVGATITAPDSGIVHFVGVVVDRPVLSIQHADGVISSFEPVASPLAAGQPVARGAPVGNLQAGHRPQPSLHLGVRVHGEYVSPLVFLGGIHPAVLLPTRKI